jgi:hypothetical protein
MHKEEQSVWAISWKLKIVQYYMQNRLTSATFKIIQCSFSEHMGRPFHCDLAYPCHYFKEEIKLDSREWLCIPRANTYNTLTFIYRRQYSHNTPSSILPVCGSLRSSTDYGCRYVCPWYMSALPRSYSYGAWIGRVMTWASGTSHPMSPCVPDSQYRLLKHLSGPATTMNCSGFVDKVEKMETDLLTEFLVHKWQHFNCKYCTEMLDLWTGNSASIWNKWSNHTWADRETAACQEQN